MRRTYAPLRTALLAVAMLAAPAAAAETAIVVDNAWARPTTSMAKAGGAFLTLRNTGAADDRLVAADSPVAERTELHTHVMEDGVARMREVEGGIAVPAGETVQLQPGGLHVMFMGLTRQLEPGSTVPVTLSFEKAGDVSVEVRVLKAGEMPPASAGGHGTGGHGGHGGGHGH